MRLSSISALEVALDVARVHAEHEERRKHEVSDRRHHALPWLDLVIRLRLGGAPVLPAPPELEPDHEHDDDQERIRRQEQEADEADEAQHPDVRMDRGCDAAAVQRNDRDQVEEVDEKPGEGECEEELGVLLLADEPDDGGTQAADYRAGEGDERLPPGVQRVLLQQDRRAEERDEHGRTDVEPLPPRLEIVAELVHEEQEDEADGELPAPEERVRGDRDEHRRRRREDLELEDRDEDELRLPDQETERDERRRELAKDAEPGLMPDRPAVVWVVRPELRLLLGRELTHRRMVAPGLCAEPAPKA